MVAEQRLDRLRAPGEPLGGAAAGVAGELARVARALRGDPGAVQLGVARGGRDAARARAALAAPRVAASASSTRASARPAAPCRSPRGDRAAPGSAASRAPPRGARGSAASARGSAPRDRRLPPPRRRPARATRARRSRRTRRRRAPRRAGRRAISARPASPHPAGIEQAPASLSALRMRRVATRMPCTPAGSSRRVAGSCSSSASICASRYARSCSIAGAPRLTFGRPACGQVERLEHLRAVVAALAPAARSCSARRSTSRSAPSAICSISTSANERTMRSPSWTSTVSCTTSADGFPFSVTRRARRSVWSSATRPQLRAARVGGHQPREISRDVGAVGRLLELQPVAAGRAASAARGRARPRPAGATSRRSGRAADPRCRSRLRADASASPPTGSGGSVKSEPTDSFTSCSSVSFTTALLARCGSGPRRLYHYTLLSDARSHVPRRRRVHQA